MIAFNHIALNCLDLAAQEEFYTKHFGFQRCRTFNKGQPNEFFLLKLGSMRLELFGTDREKTVAMQAGEQPVGFKHFAFEVPKIEPILASIAEDGIDPDFVKDCSHICPGLRVAFFRDPEGNVVELMEGYTDEV